MRQKGGRPKIGRAGYTIIETLIVLAVTATTFVVAATFISGRQARTEFQVAVRDTQSKIQQALNEASSGYYQSSGHFKCTETSGDYVKITTAGSPGERGTNGDCIYIGDSLVFGEKTMYIVPMAGQRVVTSTALPTKTLAEAKPTAIADDNNSSRNNHGPTDSIAQYQYPTAIKFIKASYNTQTLTNKTLFGFAALSSLANFSQANGLSTGMQSINLYGYSSSFSTENQAAIADTINNEPNNTGFPKIDKVRLCFLGEGVNQTFTIVVGSNSGSGMTVTNSIKNGSSC